jgi:hypothetical protein
VLRGASAFRRRAARAAAGGGTPEVQRLPEGGSDRDALQEVFRSVQELQHTLRGEVQRLHLDVRQLRDRVDHMALARRGSGRL